MTLPENRNSKIWFDDNSQPSSTHHFAFSFFQSLLVRSSQLVKDRATARHSPRSAIKSSTHKCIKSMVIKYIVRIYDDRFSSHDLAWASVVCSKGRLRRAEGILKVTVPSLLVPKTHEHYTIRCGVRRCIYYICTTTPRQIIFYVLSEIPNILDINLFCLIKSKSPPRRLFPEPFITTANVFRN